MTPAAIIREAKADGVTLALSSAGTIKAAGDGAAVNRWLPVIRRHKPEIIEALKADAANTASVSAWWLVRFADGSPLVVTCSPLATRAEVLGWYAPAGAGDAEPYAREIRKPAAPMTVAEEAAIRAWLARIGERDPVSIADILDACRRDEDARCYFMELSEAAKRNDGG